MLPSPSTSPSRNASSNSVGQANTIGGMRFSVALPPAPIHSSMLDAKVEVQVTAFAVRYVGSPSPCNTDSTRSRMDWSVFDTTN